MPNVLQEAERLAAMGIAVLPIPHGFSKPRFDWTKVAQRRANREQLGSWFEDMKLGLGAICGRISGNLTVLEFTGSGAYLTWKNKYPGLAAKLPTFGCGYADFVVIRTGEPEDTSDFFMAGYQGRA